MRAFLRRRLDISLFERSDEIEDRLPVALTKLEESAVGRRVLEARMAGVDAQHGQCWRRSPAGRCRPGVLGKPVIDRVQATVEDIVAAAPQGGARSLDVKVALRDGRLLTGTVPGVVGDVLRTVTYSRTSPRDRLTAWVRLLALTAAHPDRSFEAVTVARAPPRLGRARGDRADRAARRRARARPPRRADRALRPRHARARAARLRDLGGVRRRAERGAARKAWESSFDFAREDQDPEHVLVRGGVLTFDELMAEGRAHGRARGTWTRRAASAAGRAGCGTACWSTSA